MMTHACKRLTLAMLLVLLLAATIPVQAELAHYWVKFPHPKTLYVTANVAKLPSQAPGQDPGGELGNLNLTLHSLAGLAALAARESRGDSMIWINLESNVSYAMWLEQILKATGARRVTQPDSMALIADFAKRGLVKGYILYRADRSKRELYQERPEKVAGYTNSINVATTLAPFYEAIIVEEKSEPAFKTLGLKCLFDARDKNEQWAFEHYKDKCSRGQIIFVDPQKPHCRDYAIATRSFCTFGTGELTERILAWVEPNAPIIGWNSGDEYTQTKQDSRWAKFNTASNWCLNLPVTSTVRAGEDVPWSALQVNAKSHIDPLALDWARDRHYTAFVPTDGDNLQWFMGGFFNNADYWNAPSRSKFPIGWTAPSVCMSQVAVPTLAYMARTASANDQTMMLGGGYYYAQDYGTALKNPEKQLDAHIDQIGETMLRLGIHVLQVNNFDWDSSQTQRTYARFAQRIPGLIGIMSIQYAPYTAGKGQILWTKNRAGEPIPVISARYGMWADHKLYENEGPPAIVTDRINKASYKGPVTSSDYLDWTTVHVWSYFKKADTSKDMWAEEVAQTKGGQPGVYRGTEPLAWCVKNLAPYVKVVTPEELIWRARLHLKTRETLDGLARGLEQQDGQCERDRVDLKKYRTWLAKTPLASDEQRQEAFERLRALRFGQFAVIDPVSH